MAGDWIKMRGNLWDDPRVSKLCDLTDSTEAAIVGGLYWLWNTADQHTEDGILPGLTLRQIDRKTGIKGFGAALCDIGWLIEQADGVEIVRFEEHNGSSAKKRAVTAKRVANYRSGNDDVTQAALPNDDDSVTGALAREREREREREEEETPAAPRPKKSARRSSVPDDFAPNETGVRAANEAGIDMQAELRKFRDHHTAKGSVMADWQAAWRTWVGNAVQFGRGGKRLKTPTGDWWLAAGFANAYEAGNEGCHQHNSNLFRDGKRLETT